MMGQARPALRGAKPRGGCLLTHRGNRAAGTASAGLWTVLEAVEQGCGHLGVAEDGRPFAEGEVGGDDDRGALVEPAHEVEEQPPSGLGEGQVAEFVEDDEVAPDELEGGCIISILQLTLRSGSVRGFPGLPTDRSRPPGLCSSSRTAPGPGIFSKNTDLGPYRTEGGYLYGQWFH